MGNNPFRHLNAEQKAKLEEGKPVLLPGGISVKKNSITGKFEGMPVEWVEKYQLPFDVDYSKTIRTKMLPEEIRPEYELPDSILELINNQDTYI